MYTMSADEHFIVDRLNEHPNVAIIAGLSGHGFKFVPALADQLVHWMNTNQRNPQIEFMGIDRFDG